MNQVQLIGNLTDNPRVIVTAGGISKCDFRLAVQRDYVDQQTGKREADFINIVVWRKPAENCGKYLAKGSKCGIVGRIQTRAYDAQDGTKRYMTEVIADRVEFLANPNRQQSAAPSHSAPPSEHTPPPGFTVPTTSCPSKEGNTMGNGVISGSLKLSAGIYGKADATCPVCGKRFRPAAENVFWVTINKKKIDICGHTCFGIAIERGWKKRRPRA